MKKIIAAIFYICFLPNISLAGEIKVVTEDWPPFNYQKNGQIVGMSTEIVMATLHDAGIKADLELFPWARAYKMAVTDKNVLIYTITRTAERENLFKWIGPFAERVIFLYKLSKREDIEITSLDDIKKYKLGLLRDDATHQFFIERNFIKKIHFDLTSSEDSNIKKLFYGRVELIPGNEIALAFKVKELGFDFRRLEKAFLLIDSGGYYMAFSKPTSDDIYERVKSSFHKLESEGKINDIKNSYLK